MGFFFLMLGLKAINELLLITNIECVTRKLITH